MRLLINRSPNAVVVEQAASRMPAFVDADELGPERAPVGSEN
jgi:hypothetical protein